MTDYEYRTFPAYANSDLTELLSRQAFRTIRQAPTKILQSGTTLHQLILEPHRPIDLSVHTQTEGKRLQELALSVRERAADLLVGLTIEQPVFWHCDQTGLPLKAKPDGVRPGLVMDLKTTSSRSSAEFVSKFMLFGYDRQAAHYLQAYPDATDFLFIGVQKNKPYNVYEVWFQREDPFIETGLKKVRRLIRLAHEESLRPDGWRPSSWKRMP